MEGPKKRDHGGGLDAAIGAYGGARTDWLDLSTGINPMPYPVGEISANAWSALPDVAALERLTNAARRFWQVPDWAEVIAAPGASALIAKLPALSGQSGVFIPKPTYNEHQAAFEAHNMARDTDDPASQNHVYVHPNNPDGRLWPADIFAERKGLTVVDESFCDVTPAASHIDRACDEGVVILKSFGKFWGLAGLRLGFAIGAPSTLAGLHTSMKDMLGPWAVSGPALEVGARALEDEDWATATRTRLTEDATRMDALMAAQGAQALGGTTLFRLYEVADAEAAQDALAQHHVLTRIFPYSKTWIRLGLPHPDRWPQLERALGTAGGVIRAGNASRGNAAPSPKS